MTEPAMTDPAPPAKVDPETLVLRGRPRRVVRFRRGVIIAFAAFSSTALVGVAWIALKPAALRFAGEGQERGGLAPGRTPEVLTNAPGSYGDVPRLGPPLPGDLGRPILEHQKAIGAVTPGGAGEDQALRAAQAAQAELQRRVAERKAVRESALMVPIAGPAPAREESRAASDPATPQAQTSQGASARLALDPERDPGSQQRKLDFVNAGDLGDEVSAFVVQPARSPWTLSAGSIIAASLITGLNSDLPGLVTAQVTENAFDSVTGRILLIPQGARLIGSYDSVVAFGQKRALLVWQRIIFPDGSSVRIDNLPGSDTSGYAGLQDKVDLHTWTLLKGVALSTLLGVGTELGFGGGESDLVRSLRESTQQNAARAGDRIVSKGLSIQPTIKVRPGWPLRVVAHKDLLLRPWQGLR